MRREPSAASGRQPAGLHDRGRRRCLRGGAALALACGAPSLTGCEWLQEAASGQRIVEQRETRFGRLSVIDRGRRRYLAYGEDARVAYQSAIDLDRPHELLAGYARLMMLGLAYAQPCRSIVQIGVGAGTMAGYVIRNYPAVQVHAIDVDAHAVELGMRHFGLVPDARLHLHIADGRAWLAARRERFDVVMLDAYDDRSIPPPLADAGFYAIVADRLAPGGVAMQNLYTPQVDIARLLHAMRGSFEQLDGYRLGPNLVVAAYAGAARGPESLFDRARELDAAFRPVHPLQALLAHRALAR